MDALLEDLCTTYGWCLRPEDRRVLIAAGSQDRETVTDSIIRAEFGEAGVRDADKRDFLAPIVDDWLFDPTGDDVWARPGNRPRLRSMIRNGRRYTEGIG
jgi:hypothetical protein